MKNVRQTLLILALAPALVGSVFAKSKTKPKEIMAHSELETKPKEIMAYTELESGLSYEVQNAPAEGAQTPTTGNQLEVHYTGWLDKDGEPGQKFDSSVDRGQPFVFTVGLGQVIKGWDKGLLDMKVGEKRRFKIAPDLAYGSRGAGGSIPPNATLIFDVELISIKQS